MWLLNVFVYFLYIICRNDVLKNYFVCVLIVGYIFEDNIYVGFVKKYIWSFFYLRFECIFK